jgi:hypothetical protein
MNSAKNIKISNKRLKSFSTLVKVVTRFNFGGMKQEGRECSNRTEVNTL